MCVCERESDVMPVFVSLQEAGSWVISGYPGKRH